MGWGDSSGASPVHAKLLPELIKSFRLKLLELAESAMTRLRLLADSQKGLNGEGDVLQTRAL